jgi:hypothetical protein
MFPWRNIPSTGFPSIGVSIPAVIAGYPDMPRTRALGTTLHDGSRWRDSHYDFRGLHGSDAKAEA